MTTWASSKPIAIADIQAAADRFRPVYDAANRHDGFVSLEVSPYIANDTEKTIADAKRLWKAVGRDNLMIKIPGTEAGAPAIRAAHRGRHQRQRHPAVLRGSL